MLIFEKSHGFQNIFVLLRTKQGSPGAYDRSFRWKYHQFRFLCHVSSGTGTSPGLGITELLQHRLPAWQQELECLHLRWQPVASLTLSGFLALSPGRWASFHAQGTQLSPPCPGGWGSLFIQAGDQNEKLSLTPHLRFVFPFLFSRMPSPAT